MTEPPSHPYAGGYPQDPNEYPAPAGWGAAPASPPPPPGLTARLGARSRRRPDLRVNVILGGAGAVLALLGALEVAGGYYAHGDHSRRFLGALLFAAITVGGYAAAINRRTGGIATAGTVGAAFGLPLCLLFLTLDPADILSSGYPFNVDLVFLVSIAAWSVTYFFVPGLRGRAVFLGAAATWLFGYVSLKSIDFRSLARVTGSVFGGAGGGLDTGTVTAVGLIFGLAYYAIAAILDARGRSGAAVALVVAGFDATVGGIITGSGDMGQSGTGALLIVLGLGLSAYGARTGRRFTAWAWAAGFVFGCGLVVEDALGSDSWLGNGITLLLVGLAVVVGGHLLGTALREAPEIEDEPAPVPAWTGHPAG